MSTRGTQPFTAGFWAEKDVPDKRQRELDAENSTSLSGSLHSGDGSVFQPGHCISVWGRLFGSGWKAGTIVPTPGLKQASKCVDDECAVK